MIKKLYRLPLVLIFARDVNKLEHDPVAQYRFNRFCAIFWGIQIFLLPVTVFFWPSLWLRIEFFYVTEASLWANFATHFGAMSAALAAMNSDKTIRDMSEDIDDVHTVTDKVEDLLPLPPALTWQPDQADI